MCFRRFIIDSYVPYMIITSLLILNQIIFFFQRSVSNSYQNIGISSQVWNYGPCLQTWYSFLQPIVNWIPCTPQDSHFMVQISMWHFTINMKAIYLYVSDRSCQFLSKHPDIFTSLKLRSLSDKLHTAFFNLLYSESRAPPQGSHFMVQHFPMWHSLYHTL